MTKEECTRYRHDGELLSSNRNLCIQNLGSKCTKGFLGITFDPQPYWSWDNVMMELNSLESQYVNPFISSSKDVETMKTEVVRGLNIITNKFVMHVSDEDIERFAGDEAMTNPANMSKGTRFSINDNDLSSDSDEDDNVDFGKSGSPLVDKTDPVKAYILELEHEEKLRIKEEMRERRCLLNDDLKKEKGRAASVFTRLQKDIDAKQEIARRLDKQYQRKIAEACDIHLSAVQRDHEQRSEIEERKIRKDADAASEEAKRKEKIEREEKEWLEKVKAEAEAKMKAENAAMEARAREAKHKAEKESAEKAAMEARTPYEDQEKAEKEAAEKPALEASQKNAVQVSDMASKLETRRMSKFVVLTEQNQAIRAGSGQSYKKHERQIRLLILQMTASVETVRKNSIELVKIMKDPYCPQSILIGTFSEKVVSYCKLQNMNIENAFALAHVMVLVSSQVSDVMDIVLAEFHKACIYTVPKHIVYSKSSFGSKESYYKVVGYEQEDGNFESTGSYLERIEAYLTLYGALLQTEIPGIENPHGLKEGWAWLARFLNVLPAHRATAAALIGFLRVAGYAMFCRYGNQFSKMLRLISRSFLPKLKAKQDPLASHVVIKLENYLLSNQHLSEPEGSHFAQRVDSKDFGF